MKNAIRDVPWNYWQTKTATKFATFRIAPMTMETAGQTLSNARQAASGLWSETEHAMTFAAHQTVTMMAGIAM